MCDDAKHWVDETCRLFSIQENPVASVRPLQGLKPS
jgi:hypothetical protein